MVFVFVDDTKGDGTLSQLAGQHQPGWPGSHNQDTRGFFLFHGHPFLRSHPQMDTPAARCRRPVLIAHVLFTTIPSAQPAVPPPSDSARPVSASPLRDD